jgi:hypothetical protein
MVELMLEKLVLNGGFGRGQSTARVNICYITNTKNTENY